LLLSSQGEVDHQIVEYIQASSSAQQEKEEKERQAERMRVEAQEAAKRERLELEAIAARRLARHTPLSWLPWPARVQLLDSKDNRRQSDRPYWPN
jgi:hypothetical protein